MVQTIKVSYSVSKKRNNSKGNANEAARNFINTRIWRKIEKKPQDEDFEKKYFRTAYSKKAGFDKKISQLKLNLPETFGMSGNFIENTVKWHQKKV